MEQIGKFKLYSMEEVLDKHFGPIGTTRRDEHEKRVADAVHAYLIWVVTQGKFLYGKAQISFPYYAPKNKFIHAKSKKYGNIKNLQM